MAHHGRKALGVSLAFLGIILLGLPALAEAAEFGIVPGSFAVRMLNASGQPEDRSGSHPDRLQAEFALSVEETGTSVRGFAFELPPGFGGDPKAVPPCPRATVDAEEECPPESQIGLLRFGFANGQQIESPIFQLEPAPGQLAAFALKPGFEVPFTLVLRPGDYALTMRADDLPQTPVPMDEGQVELWGVPADHETGTTIPRRAFLTAPTVCGPLAFTLRVRSWEEGAQWTSADAETEAPLGGCEGLGFGPELGLRLSEPLADAPTGLTLELRMPEESDPGGLANAELKGATVALPEGVTVSPAGAAGLSACSDSQFAQDASSEPLCPAASRVGTIDIASPELPDALHGTIYLGQERPHERFRLLVAAPAFGTVIKFSGALRTDPATGRPLAVLDDLPQVALSRIDLEIAGGPRALLASPLTCGPATASGSFQPFGGGATRDAEASVAIAPRLPGTPCPSAGPFAPQLLAAVSSTRAGHATSFSTTLLRQAGEQLPRRFSVELPAGLNASLGTVAACPSVAVQTASCPAQSRIGTARAEVGSGPSPVSLGGDVYVTGPYQRAPFGLLIQFHAALGPFDLGTLSFRASAEVNGRNGRVTVVTDPLPEVIEGVPIRFQSIELTLDRRGLLHNPTACGSHRVQASIEAQSGLATTATSAFGVRGCARLGFKPRIHMVLARATGKPSSAELRVSAHLRAGDTSLRAMQLTLPPELALDGSSLRELCSARDAAAGLCPSGSRVGTASARTSLLDRPLRGAVYVAQPRDGGSPDLWVDLAADGLQVRLRGETSSRHGRFRSQLVGLPDMPLSSFAMRLGSATQGLFALGDGLCRQRRLVAVAAIKGQDGVRRELRPAIQTGAVC